MQSPLHAVLVLPPLVVLHRAVLVRHLQEVASTDGKTGLLNAAAWEDRAGRVLERAQRSRLGAALLILDLDHFKQVNDRFGHATGDAVLQDVAYTMRATLRAGDSIYRVGGEEILVILPGAGHADAIEIAERLCVAVRKRRPSGVTVSLSIGVAVAEPDTIDTDDLLARADASLYAAKASGRDRIHVDDCDLALVSG
jgi:diguanylate cyclase (GGDEF)-like protein